MRGAYRPILPLLLLSWGIIAHPVEALARSQRDLAYQTEIAWTAAVRLLRVDLGFQLVERDQEARFVLFRYSEGEHVSSGSLEIVERTLEDGRQGVRVIVAIPAMPAYVELHLIDRLERKLLEEVGPPLPAPPRERRQQPRRDEDDSEEDDDDREADERDREEGEEEEGEDRRRRSGRSSRRDDADD